MKHRLAEKEALNTDPKCNIESSSSTESKIGKKIYEILILKASNFKSKYIKGTKMFQQNQTRIKNLEKNINDLIETENLEREKLQEEMVRVL